jgi:hypothetical protein
MFNLYSRLAGKGLSLKDISSSQPTPNTNTTEMLPRSKTPEAEADSDDDDDYEFESAPLFAIDKSEITLEALQALLVNENDSEKQRIPHLVKAEKALARYLYLKKGLSTYKDKASATNAVNTVYNIATASPAPTFDMLDKTAKTNLHHYRDYVRAVEKASLEGNGPKILLAELQAIAAKILPKPGLPGLFNAYQLTRFQVCIRDLLNAYEAAFKESEGQQQLFVQAVKTLHAPIRPKPGSQALENEVAHFIKFGPVTPLDRVLTHDLKDYPEQYAFNDKGERLDPLAANRMDAKINYLLMKHEEEMDRPFAEIHTNGIIQCVYQSLDMMKEMHKILVDDKAHELFAAALQAMQAHFQHYLKKEHGPMLLAALSFTTDCCDTLQKLLKDKPETKKTLDPDLATAYLSAIKHFTQLPQTHERLKGVAETIETAGRQSYLDALNTPKVPDKKGHKNKK